MLWYRRLTTAQRVTFWACFGGWALDALDLQMFAQAIPALIATWGITKAQAGLAGGISLMSLSLGGWLVGALSDRFSRLRMLQLTVAWFSLFTLLTGVAQNFDQLLIFKVLQGFGFGGEWAVGAALLSETIPAESRGRALGLVQSAWAVGWGAAVLLYTGIFLWFEPQIAWRVMFCVGVIPAFLILYVRRRVPEPPKAERAAASGFSAFMIFSPQLLVTTIVGALFGIGARGGYYALMTWLPAYLQSDRHLSITGSSASLAVVIVAFWCGCAACAFLMDKLGRRNTVLGFSLGCIATVFVYMYLPFGNATMVVLGFPLGFFAAGVPASMGAWFSELYPATARGAGVGFCYCFGGVIASMFPALVGKLGERMSLGTAIMLVTCVCYAVVIVSALLLRETGRGTQSHAAGLRGADA